VPGSRPAHGALRRGLAPILVVLVLALIAAACDAETSPSAPRSGHPATLAGTSWTIASVDGQPHPAGGADPTIAFDGALATGFAGCNDFTGRYAYDPATGRLQWDGLGINLVGCADDARAVFEMRFFDALGRVDLVGENPDGELVLSGPLGQIVLVPATA